VNVIAGVGVGVANGSSLESNVPATAATHTGSTADDWGVKFDANKIADVDISAAASAI